MSLHTLFYFFYIAARKVVRASGLINPVRAVLGPVLGRFLLRLASDDSNRFMVNGHEMILAGEDRYPPIAMVMGNYEQQTTQLFSRLIKPGMVVVDVGAHVGYYTLLAAKQVGPTGKVYAFEPEPVNHNILLQNIELNGYEHVEAKAMAVSDQVGHSALYLTTLDNGRHSMYQQDSTSQESLEVETTSLDDFFESLGWPQVDLVKIDAEGSEVAVLQGMQQILERSSSLNLIVEFNPALLHSAGVDPLKFLEMPNTLGFKVSLIQDKDGLVPIESSDPATLTGDLIAKENSTNLLWEKN